MLGGSFPGRTGSCSQKIGPYGKRSHHNIGHATTRTSGCGWSLPGEVGGVRRLGPARAARRAGSDAEAGLSPRGARRLSARGLRVVRGRGRPALTRACLQADRRLGSCASGHSHRHLPGTTGDRRRALFRPTRIGPSSSTPRRAARRGRWLPLRVRPRPTVMGLPDPSRAAEPAGQGRVNRCHGKKKGLRCWRYNDTQ